LVTAQIGSTGGCVSYEYFGSQKIKVIFYGVGAIGSEVAKFGVSRPGLEVVGAIDADPGKIGLDLGTVLGLEENLGIKVRGDPAALFSEVEADVVCSQPVLSCRQYTISWRPQCGPGST
jgi:hypothetical protein